MKMLRCAIVALLLVGLMAAGIPVQAFATGRKVVRVGFPIQQNNSFVDENGNYAGYLVDYLNQLSMYTGWEYEYVQVEGDLNTQLSTLLDMLQTGEIDMLGTMNRNSELEQLFLYPSYNYGTAYTTLTVRDDAQEWVEDDYEHWNGITVATYPKLEGRMELLEQYAAVNGFTYETVECETQEETLRAVREGRADATIQVDVSMADGFRGIARFAPNPYYFALYKGNTRLLQELNVALSTMNRTYPHLQTELYNRYFAFKNQFFLSEDNEALIRSLGTVRVMFYDGNAPFQYMKDGQISGIAADYMKRFSEATGLQYEAVVAESFGDGLDLIDKGEVDIVACIATNSQVVSEKGLRLSLPYFTSNRVVVSAASTDQQGDTDELGFLMNTEAALNQLCAGDPAVYWMDSFSVNYYLRKQAIYHDIKVDWGNTKQCTYSVGVTDRMPEELLTILNHYASSLDDTAKQNMLNQSSADAVEYTLTELLYIYRHWILSAVVVLCLLICIYVLYFRGKRAHQQMEASVYKLNQLCRYDELTGANNGAYFRKLLEQACQEKCPLALAALNIRNFKYINETFGLMAADRVLCQIKLVLDDMVHTGEFFCRESADVFYIALQENTPEALAARIHRICTCIRQEVRQVLQDYPLALYSGGVLTAQSPEPYSATNLSYMMAALAQAKKENRQDICIYDEKLHQAEQLRHYVESHMHTALAAEEFQLYLQPKMDLSEGCLYGAEALVRWQPKDRDMIFPDQFIPLFEENGFCVQLDLYMVEQACKQLRTWIDQGMTPISISVNQTKLLFGREDYVDRLLAITRKYQVQPKYITLEILEGLALDSIEKLNSVIERLNAAGFRVSMDDFGSGYSSLNTLGKIKIDELKLDRLFLYDVAKDTHGTQRKVLASILALAKELNIRTVAEGVETQENEQMMIELDCDYGQGYYYSKPIPADRFLDEFLLPFTQRTEQS